DDMTGANGDWQLEVSTGAIEAEVALSSAAQASYSENLVLLTNGDFEQGLTGWKSFRSDGVITNDSVSGSSALEITGSSRGVKQELPASAGGTYTLTGSAKSNSTGNSTIGITFYDQNMSRLRGGSSKIRNNNWSNFRVEKDAPAGTAFMRVWAYKSSDDGSFFIDNLSLDSGGAPPPPPSGGELLSNSGFESGLSSWQGFTGTERVSTTESFAGSRSLELTAAGSGTKQTVRNAIAGETYTISGYGKSSSSGYVGFGFNFFDANNTKLAGGKGRRVRGNSWQQYENSAVAPPGTQTIRIWTSKASGDGVAYLDDLSLTGGGGGNPPADTAAPTANLNATNITLEGAERYRFEVVFGDDTAVDVSTLDSNDIRITGPNGFNQRAVFEGVNNTTDGTPRTATYYLDGPGGLWDGDDNGLYSVFLEANQVRDTSGNAVSSSVSLGDFIVDLSSDVLPLGNLNSGVVARDDASGVGYLMYSQELVDVRFLSGGIFNGNASNLVAVQYNNGQWFYDTNDSLVAFTPRNSDRLLAELDFSADTATLLVGTRSTINGIAAGYASGDLVVTPNRWNGQYNLGEFGISGSEVVLYGNNDTVPGQLSFSTSSITRDENAGTVNLTVNRVGGSDGVVTVEYATTGVSATEGQDYSGRSGMLTFNDGQTQRSIAIPIIDDTEGEAEETFVVTLNNATGDASIGLGSTVVAIRENDGGPNGANPGDLLPDVIPLANTSSDYRIDTDEIPGQVLLRLSTEVANIGDGPLELWGTQSSADVQPVFQRIYDDEGGFRDELAGEFVNHPSHGHLHFEGFATYNLRAVNSDGSVGDIVGSGGKTSFCLININQPFPELTNQAIVADGRGGSSCGRIQGVDVGYSDVYGRWLPDQWIDVTNIQDGTYWLEIIADPDNNILESDETNNVDYLQVTLDNPRFS
ncbi:MAG: Calx-beta domain-containing protein, partial [Cyanobacteria bacterium J06632_22]